MSNVLLIEDSPTQAAHFAMMLEDAGFGVEQAGSLASGLDRLAQGGVDVLLLDLTLPDTEGLQTFQTAHAHAARTPIVVLTHVDDEELAAHTLEHGAQDYLVKGEVNETWLTRAVQHAVARGRAAGKTTSPTKSTTRTIAPVEIEESGDVTIARIRERRLLEVQTITAASEQLFRRIAAGCKKLVVSLGEVEYISNGALGVLLAVRRRVVAQQGDVCLCEVAEGVYDQFKTRQFHKLFAIYKTVDEATRSLTDE